MADVPRCYCTVVFEADAKPIVDRSNCRVHEDDDLTRELLGAQRVIAVLLHKLGGSAVITLADEMEVTNRRPKIVRWPSRIVSLSQEWELFDKDGARWAERIAIRDSRIETEGDRG